MPITTINFSDPVTSLVTKTNTISQNLGDIEELTVADDNTVDAINRLKSEIDTIDTTIADFKDSVEIVDIARHSIRVVDAGGLGSLTYGAGGTITYTGPGQGDVRDLISLDEDADSVMSYDVANGRLGLKALPTHKIRDDAINTIKLANNAVTTPKILDGAVTTPKILDGAVTGAKILDGAVTGAKISSNTLTSAKFSSAVSLQILNSSGSVVKTIYSPGS